MFTENLGLGIQHILGPEGYDHILFLVTICVVFTLDDWKKILVLLTAFTLGHCLTLILAALHISSFSPHWISIFIPSTILIASIQNLVRLSDKSQNRVSLYPLVLSFGFIHGLGISNDLVTRLGREAEISIPLFAFNVGIEIGQLFVIAGFMVISFVLTRPGRIKQKHFIFSLSLLSAVLSSLLIVSRIG